MKTRIRLGLVILSFVITAVFLLLLPDRVPVHYGWDGNVDSIASKFLLLIIPIIIFSVAILMEWIIKMLERKIDTEPYDKKVGDIKGSIDIMQKVSLIILGIANILCIYVLVLVYSNSDSVNLWGIDFYALVTVLISTLIIFLGSMMPKSSKNGIFGVRTPWSQYNDKTWRHSNYYGGIIMIIGGVISILMAILMGGWVSELIMLLIIVLATIISIAISYRFYRIEKEKHNEEV